MEDRTFGACVVVISCSLKSHTMALGTLIAPSLWYEILDFNRTLFSRTFRHEVHLPFLFLSILQTCCSYSCQYLHITQKFSATVNFYLTVYLILLLNSNSRGSQSHRLFDDQQQLYPGSSHRQLSTLRSCHLTNLMANPVHILSDSIKKRVAKSVPLALIMVILFYPLYLISQSLTQYFEVKRREGVFAVILFWFQTCHRQITSSWPHFSATQYFGVLHHTSPRPNTYPLEYKPDASTESLVARASDTTSLEASYSQPTFPYNILPGSVELTCQNFSGYALERCKADVITRTQLFIALASVFCFIILCVMLITMLTWIRRMKARRKLRQLTLSGKSSRQTTGIFIPPSRKNGGRVFNIKTPRRGTVAAQSLNREEAVEAEEQGLADQDIPVALDGMNDGWIQWIRQRANMVCNLDINLGCTKYYLQQQVASNTLVKQGPIDSIPDAPSTTVAHSPAPRIPSLKLPKPTLTTFRKAGGLDPALEEPSFQSLKGNGKGKEKLRVRWDGTV